MIFKRVLKEKFIEEVNRLYGIKNSWWRKMADDEDAFILIRNNKILVLVNGGRLLQIKMDGKGMIKCEAHEDFLSLRNTDKPYVKIDEESTGSIKRVEGLVGISKHYQKVKRRIKLFTGREKQVVQYLSQDISQIIDLEIGLEGKRKQGASRKGAQRIDMLGVSDSGNLVFFEVKLFDNSEIRSRAVPRVVAQLKKYKKLLNKDSAEILSGYQNQFEMYQKLRGRFFKRRLISNDKLKLYPNVRLIITGFDGSQKDHLLPSILQGIRDGMHWSEKSPDLIAIGNHSSLKKSRLFKGIK